MEAGRFDEIMNELKDKRTELTRISIELEGLANNYSNDTAITKFSRGLRSYTLITRDAFNKVEDLYRANATLKTQIEVLKEMLLSIDEIKNNESFKERIQREFTDKHNVPYHPRT